MSSASIFRWRVGAGWLVLAPTLPPDSDLRAQAVQRANHNGALAVAMLNGDLGTSEALLDDLEELGAPSGYLVDLLMEDDAAIEGRLAEASIVVLEAAADLGHAISIMSGAALRGIEQAYSRGALILAEGASALIFAAVAVDSGGVDHKGFGWLDNAILLPETSDLTTLVRPILTAQPSLFALSIGSSTAMVFGPSGHVETWGAKRIVVTLGQHYSAR